MQFYDVIESRLSIHSFKDTPIEKDKLARMIHAAMQSPSWKNNASYRFILIDHKQEKEALAQCIINDTNQSSQSIKQAPMVAVVVGEPSDSGIIKDREYYLVDGAIAMEHFVLAATNEGYGTCWIAALDEDKVRQALSIPQNFRVIAITPVGEIAESKEHNPKKDVREHVFLNEWGKSYTENDHYTGIH